MKQSKLFTAVATVVLLAGGVLASKANNEFKGPTTIYYRLPANTLEVGLRGISTDNLVTTNSASGKVAYFNVGSTKYTLVTQNNTILYLL
jgi:hypothetical protein